MEEFCWLNLKSFACLSALRISRLKSAEKVQGSQSNTWAVGIVKILVTLWLYVQIDIVIMLMKIFDFVRANIITTGSCCNCWSGHSSKNNYAVIWIIPHRWACTNNFFNLNYWKLMIPTQHSEKSQMRSRLFNYHKTTFAVSFCHNCDWFLIIAKPNALCSCNVVMWLVLNHAT